MESSCANLVSEVTLWTAATRFDLYAVLDAAAAPEILAWLNQNECEHAILYNGELADALSDTGPYIVPLSRTGECIKSLISSGWHNNWGFLLESTHRLDELRAHFRHFTAADLPDGERVLFAFYDPRSLASFLKAATDEQRGSFLHPLQSLAYPVVDFDGRTRLITARRELKSETSPRYRSLQFTAAQMQVFEADLDDRFAAEIARTLRRCFPWFIRTRPFESLIGLAKAALKKAHALNFRIRGDIVKFSALMLVTGENFDENPAIREFLSIDDSLRSERLDLLLTELPKRLRGAQTN